MRRVRVITRSCTWLHAFPRRRTIADSACALPCDTKAEHVADIGLGGAKDQAIWEYAARVAAVIVSKDEDFAQRTFFGKGGPLVVWIRLPNSPKRELLLWFEPLLPSTDHRGLGTG
jgi:predicted nuclease of predicted toxin-antitoxin system